MSSKKLWADTVFKYFFGSMKVRKRATKQRFSIYIFISHLNITVDKTDAIFLLIFKNLILICIGYWENLVMIKWKDKQP